MKKKKHQEELADLLFPSDVEDSEDRVLNIPPEQRRLHTDTYDFTVSTIISEIKIGRIYVPEFQRRYVWNDAQASRLIESLIIQCPIPVIYLNQEKDERLSVIDGNQRLQTLSRFIRDEFKLRGLTVYPEIEGNSYKELDPRFQRHILNRTLRCITILKETHPQVKFDVFERLNTGSVKLSPQELRHGMYYGDLVKLAEVCSKITSFRNMVSVSNNKRMKLEELVIRYWAFAAGLTQYKKPLTNFLNEFCSGNLSLNESSRNSLKENFEEAIEITKQMIGNLAFKIYDEDREVRSKFNAALYDCQMQLAHHIRKNKIPIPKQKYCQNETLKLLKDTSFQSLLTKATSDENNVKSRIRRYRAAILQND